MMNKKTILFFLIGSLIGIIFLHSCKKDDAPSNPFDTINHNSTTTTDPLPDPNSIQGLYKNIFSIKCANPGCHDGTFEPDFRTIESSFSTLVYQPVNKVTLDSLKLFTHRVIPHNSSDSWLIERLTTSTTEYMPSNSVRLSSSDIDHVKNWINAGCPDQNGTLPVKPNLQPNVIGYVALDSVYQRIDTNRVNGLGYNPFIIEEGKTLTMLFVAVDTADGADGTDPSIYTSKKIKLSTSKNDFSSAITINAFTYLAAYQAWLVVIPTSMWPSGTTVYFRIYVNDGDHTADAEFPRNESIDYYKTLYAFYVQ